MLGFQVGLELDELGNLAEVNEPILRICLPGIAPHELPQNLAVQQVTSVGDLVHNLEAGMLGHLQPEVIAPVLQPQNVGALALENEHLLIVVHAVHSLRNTPEYPQVSGHPESVQLRVTLFEEVLQQFRHGPLLELVPDFIDLLHFGFVQECSLFEQPVFAPLLNILPRIGTR